MYIRIYIYIERERETTRAAMQNKWWWMMYEMTCFHLGFLSSQDLADVLYIISDSLEACWKAWICLQWVLSALCYHRTFLVTCWHWTQYVDWKWKVKQPATLNKAAHIGVVPSVGWWVVPKSTWFAIYSYVLTILIGFKGSPALRIDTDGQGLKNADIQVPEVSRRKWWKGWQLCRSSEADLRSSPWHQMHRAIRRALPVAVKRILLKPRHFPCPFVPE